MAQTSDYKERTNDDFIDKRSMRSTYRWGNNSNWERFNCDKLFICDGPTHQSLPQRQCDNRNEQQWLYANIVRVVVVRHPAWYLESETGVEQREGSKTALEPTIPLPSKARWVAKENGTWHTELRIDLAMLINSPDKNLDFVEVFCSPTSQLTKTAQDAHLRRKDGQLMTLTCQNRLDVKKLWID